MSATCHIPDDHMAACEKNLASSVPLLHGLHSIGVLRPSADCGNWLLYKAT